MKTFYCDFMMVTVLRCWWQHNCVGYFLVVLVTFFTRKIRQQHRKYKFHACHQHKLSRIVLNCHETPNSNFHPGKGQVMSHEITIITEKSHDYLSWSNRLVWQSWFWWFFFIFYDLKWYLGQKSEGNKSHKILWSLIRVNIRNIKSVGTSKI